MNGTKIDSLGNENYLAEQDCLYVVGDTMINGKTFTHYTGDNYTFSQPLNWFWRDSSHYLIDQTGRLQFSTHSEIDTLGTFEGPFYNVNYLTDGIEHAITVPAGTFNSYVHESHYHNLNGTPYTACDSIFVKTRSFSNGVGIITEQSGYIFQIQKRMQILGEKVNRILHCRMKNYP